MRRKVASIAVSVIVITVMSVPVPAGGVAGFGDIDTGKFYTEAVQWMVDNAITTGTSPTCFSPANPVTRGQAAAFMWRMEGFPTGSPPHPFTDVVALWQQDPISWMAAQGITTGTTPTTYSAANPVTRGDLAALLHRLAGSPSAPAPTQFPDVTKPWQITPVGWMLQQGITTGTTPTTFSPDKTVTRGQLATFFYRYKESPPVVVDPNHPAIPVCETQVPGPSTTGTLNIITNTTLIQNHNGNIVIDADNITLDCAGHTVTGNGTGEVSGIMLEGRTGVTVRNCHVSGFEEQGMNLSSSHGNTIEGNHLSDNVNVSLDGQAFGIFLWSSTNNTVSNNLMTRNSHDGIHLGADSDGNTVVGNTATANLGDGIDLHWANNNALTDNVATNNRHNGFSIHMTSDGNTLSGNRADNNVETGFSVAEGSDGNTLSLNEASGNGEFGITDSSTGGTGDAGTDNNYTNNTCTGNGSGNSSPYGLCWG